jgi:nitrogen-specific signal transduction histidine kinase
MKILINLKPMQLQQVLLNLILNAKDAMLNGGKIQYLHMQGQFMLKANLAKALLLKGKQATGLL